MATAAAMTVSRERLKFMAKKIAEYGGKHYRMPSAISVSEGLWILHDAAFAEFALPCPGIAHGILDGGVGHPAEYLVGILGIGPNLFDIAGAAGGDLVGYLDAGCLFKGVDKTDRPLPVPRLKISTESVSLFSSIRFIAMT